MERHIHNFVATAKYFYRRTFVGIVIDRGHCVLARKKLTPKKSQK